MRKAPLYISCTTRSWYDAGIAQAAEGLERGRTRCRLKELTAAHNFMTCTPLRPKTFQILREPRIYSSWPVGVRGPVPGVPALASRGESQVEHVSALVPVLSCAACARLCSAKEVRRLRSQADERAFLPCIVLRPKECFKMSEFPLAFNASSSIAAMHNLRLESQHQLGYCQIHKLKMTYIHGLK